MKKLLCRVLGLISLIMVLQFVPLGASAYDSYSIDTMEELRQLAKKSYSTETYVHYHGEGDLVLDQDLTLPYNLGLYAYCDRIIVEKGVTFRSGRFLSTDELIVKGTAYLNLTHVENVLNVTGKVYGESDIYMDTGETAVVTGADKIAIKNGYNIVFWMGAKNTQEFLARIKVAKASTDDKFQYRLEPEGDFVLTQSVTLPDNCFIADLMADSVTIGAGCTLTVNDRYYAQNPLIVKGKLVNNGHINMEEGGTLTVASGGSYSGWGSIQIFDGMHHRDVISGVNWDDFTITDYSDYREVRYVAGLSKQAKPTSLKWGKLEDFWVYDESAGEYVQKDITVPGGMAFKPGDSKAKKYYINLYNSKNTLVKSWTSRWDEVPEWCSWVEFLLGDYPSDSYYFTVTAAGDYVKTRDSETVKSKVFKYTKPSKKLGACTDVSWKQNAKPSFDNSGSSYLLGYQLDLYYSFTKSGEPTLIDRQWYVTQYASKDNIFDRQILDLWHLEEYGSGYYFYKVRALSNNINTRAHGAWSDMSNGIYMEPMKMKESNKESTGKPKISWNELKDAEEYEVYRATSKNGTFKKVKTTTSKSYTDKDAKAGKTYYYKVRGVTKKGVKMLFSEVISRGCDLAQPDVSAKNVSSSGKPKLSWDKISGAEKYYVYRSTSKNGEYEKIKSTTSTSYTDKSAKAGKKYYYKVKAIHEKSSCNSTYSEPLAKYCDLARPDVSIKLKSGDPKLSWDKVSGAEKYYVYRASSKDGKYKKIASTTGRSYTDKSAKAGKTYYYKVKAIDSNTSCNSAYSSVDYIKAK